MEIFILKLQKQSFYDDDDNDGDGAVNVDVDNKTEEWLFVLLLDRHLHLL